MKKIAISVINDLATDNRVHKVAVTLQEMGHEVTLIGRLLPDSLSISRTYHTRRMHLFFNKGPLFYIEYNIRLFFVLLMSNFNAFVSNDLDTLLANYLVSQITGSPLFYDSHEYFTEVPELIQRPRTKRFWEKMEEALVPRVKYAYTVCQSIAEAYRYKYGTYFHLVRNVPYRLRKVDIQEDKKLNFAGKKIIIYQGALNIGRGLEQMINAMQYIDNAVFIVVGTGDIENRLRIQASQLKLDDKVKFFGRVPFDKLLAYTMQADIGLSIEEDLGLNYKYALPNKLFDYIQSEIPVLVSDLPEMKRIVGEYTIGAILESHKPKQIASQLNNILFDKDQLATWKINLQKAAEELCWENEKDRLKEVYKILNIS